MIRWAAVVWVATFLLAFGGIQARTTYGAQVSVDEPQYLLTALSLATQFDLDVSDEIAAEAYRDFHEADLNQQTIPLDDAGRRFSPHDPLLPLLLAPAMGQWGWVGARTALAGLGALCAVVTFWVAARRLGATHWVAAIVTVGFFGAPPLTSYSTQIYPEIVAGLLCALGLGAVLPGVARGEPNSVSEWGRAGAVVLAVVGLPWLSVKYVPVAGALALGYLTARRKRGASRAQAALVLIVLSISAVLYAVVHQRIYGGWTVYSAGDHFVETGEFAVVGVTPEYGSRVQRFVNLWVDRRFGLVPWNPAWLVALGAGSWLAVRSRPFRYLALPAFLAGFATAAIVALTMHGWWWPGRQTVVVLPVLVVAAAVAASRSRAILGLAVVGCLAGIANWQVVTAEARRGERALVVDFWETRAWPYRALEWMFPDFVFDARPWPLQVGWGVVLGVIVVTGGWVARRSAQTRPAAVSGES